MIAIRPLKYIDLFVLMALVALYCVGTYDRNQVWKEDLTLWLDTVEKSPGKARPHFGVGYVYNFKGYYDRAIVELKKALSISPDYFKARNSLGVAYSNKGLYDEAYFEAHHNLGLCYARKGLTEMAIFEYEKAVALKPHNITARTRLANAYALKGMTDKAIAEYSKLVAATPDNPDIYYNLGIAFSEKKEYSMAARMFAETVRLRPDDRDAHLKLAESLARQK